MRLYLPSILIVGVAAMLALAPPLSGQTEMAAMTGFVSDSTGRVVPAADVVATARQSLAAVCAAVWLVNVVESAFGPPGS